MQTALGALRDGLSGACGCGCRQLTNRIKLAGSDSIDARAGAIVSSTEMMITNCCARQARPRFREMLPYRRAEVDGRWR